MTERKDRRPMLDVIIAGLKVKNPHWSDYRLRVEAKHLWNTRYAPITLPPRSL